jgi:putative hydrolase of the HAD superfamily
MKKIRAICFDLDDTLWDMRSVIPRAEGLLYDWFAANYPRVTAAYTPADIRTLRLAANEQWPELRHDLTELRTRILRQVAATAGYDETMVTEAFAVFIAARNDVVVYADVEPVLTRLAGAYRLFALSNGNADLEKIGLASYFTGIYSASRLGVAKPDGRFFRLAAERCDFKLDEMLHVGDHPENDILAAQQVGMSAVWLNRAAARWPLAGSRPDYEVADLNGLERLMQL